MNYTYKMFEKELTNGNHVSYHFAYEYFDTLSPKNSKLYQYEKKLKTSVTDHFNLIGFQNALTTPNTTIGGDAHFHVGVHRRLIDDSVKNFFHINSNFLVIYFTKKVGQATEKSSYKCGYSQDTLKSLKHPLEGEGIKLLEIFKNETAQSIFASNFTQDGKLEDNELNFEIKPHYSSENYFKLKNKIIENFDVREEILNRYDKKFINYSPTDFHFHFKIKLSEKPPVVKFYRTFPAPTNPYFFC